MNWADRKPTLWERVGRVVDHLFPERQIHLRTEGRVRFVRFGQRLQIFIVLILAAAGGWTGYATVSFVRHDTVVAEKDGLINNSRQAYRGLLGEVAEYQRKFTALTRDLEDSHVLMLNLVQKNATLQQSLTSVAKQLNVTRSERERVASARANLKNKLDDIETQMRDLASKNFTLSDNLSTTESDLQTALVERNQALFEGTRMRRQITDLETRLTDLQETEELAVQRLTESTTTYIDTMEKVVELTGLKVDQVLAGHDFTPKGRGGPFIAAAPDGLPAQALKENLLNLDNHLDRWEALQDVMERIPLAPPLNSFYITSSYGKRRDPINRRWAAHYGIDLGSVFKSSVYATAPGVVTYAGWKGKYGKLVEISHGAGLKTRYGHLHKIYVKKGQKVEFRKKIGLLGSTGRSTGAHLHYEVAFKGRTRNPMNFIKAGRYVFQD